MFKSIHFFCAVRAFEIMKNRGQRSWSVGLSIADITNSVLMDKKKTHSVSTLAQVVQWHLTVMCCVALLLFEGVVVSSSDVRVSQKDLSLDV